MNLRTIAIVLGLAAVSACEKGTLRDISAPASGAQIKFYNFGINAPGVNFYANGTKVTATSSSSGVEATTGTAYGSVGNAGFYSELTPGAYSFTGRSPATADNNLVVATITATLADAKYYSLYLSGFYDATAKQVDGFVVQDDFPTTVDFNVTTVRFVNASPNSQPMQLFAKSTVSGVETPIGGPIAYKSATPFVTYPPASYDLSARAVGSTTNLISRAAVSFSGGRVYTISARGDMTVTSTTATNRPFLDNTANR